jgi:broad specificity phosphatase PhoE
MPQQIVLVRHGRSAHVHREGWVDAAGLERWRAAYEAAAIDPADAPPPALLARVAGAGALVASDAPRAVASAARLAAPGAEPPVVTPLLRETDLRVPRWVGWRMPLAGWAVAIGVEWLRGAAPGGRVPAATLARAAQAAELLATLAGARGCVVAVTHGDFRRLLAARLRQLGWSASPGRRSYRNWSAWEFARPAAPG